jgi:hypothetical protein
MPWFEVSATAVCDRLAMERHRSHAPDAATMFDDLQRANKRKKAATLGRRRKEVVVRRK